MRKSGILVVVCGSLWMLSNGLIAEETAAEPSTITPVAANLGRARGIAARNGAARLGPTTRGIAAQC